MRSLMILAVLAGAPAFAADGEAVLAAAELPETAKDLRDAGVDADQVSAAIDAAKAAELNAADTATALGGAAPLVKEHGPVDNFGEFVKGKLDEGLRGEELAAAIKSAHEKGGKGGGDKGGKGGKAAESEPSPKPKPTVRPKPPPRGPMTRPGGGGGRTRPGSGTRPQPGPKPKPKPRGGGGGGGMTRPGGAR